MENSSKAVDTRQEIAAAAQVSTDTVRKVEKILKKASDEDKQKLRSGETSINKVFKVVSGNEKKEQLHYTVGASESEDEKPSLSTTADLDSVTLKLSAKHKKTLLLFGKELKYCDKKGNVNVDKVLRLMLDYFSRIANDINEWGGIEEDETICDYFPEPSTFALINYFDNIDNTKSLVNSIDMKTYEFSDWMWHHIFGVPNLRSTSQQKAQLSAALEECSNRIKDRLDKLIKNYLSEE